MDSPLPLWQTALLSQGCKVKSGDEFFPLQLHPVGDRIVCTPTVSGALMPFEIEVKVGQPVTITWDRKLSRYIVSTGGMPEAA